MPTGSTPYDYFYIQGLSGGLNTKESPLDIKDNELQIALNAVLTTTGAIKSREGYIEDSGTALGAASQITNIYRYYRSGSSITVVSAIVGVETKVYTYTTGGGYTEITGGSALGTSKVRFKDYKGWLFMWDGVTWQATEDGTTKADVVFKTDPAYVATQKDIRLMEICDDRIFIVFNSAPNTVYFSDYGGFNTAPSTEMLFPLANTIDIPVRSGDSAGITNLKNYSNNDELLIFRENDTFILLGVGSTDYVIRMFRSQAGCVSYDGVVETSLGQLIVIGNAKIFMIDADQMIDISAKIQSTWANITMTDLWVSYDSVRNLVYVKHPSGGVYVWNMSNYAFDERPLSAWTYWDLDMQCGTRFQSAADGSTFYFYKTNDTVLYYLGGYSDNTDPIDFDFQTKIFDFGEFAEKKEFRGLKFMQDTAQSQPFDVSIYLDNSRKIETRPLILAASGNKWGTMVWGTGKWAGTNRLNGSVIIGQNMNGFEFSVRITKSDTYALTVHKIAIEFMPRNRERNRT